MSLYLQPGDLDDLPGVDDADPAMIAKLIEKAEVRLARTVKRRGCSLATLAADPELAPIVKDVLENAVQRVLRNPDGASQEAEGDYSIGYNPIDAAGNIWFPEQDLADLCPASSSGAVGSIQTFIPSHRVVTGRYR